EAAADLSDDDLAAVEKSEMEPGFDHLNAELLTDKHAAD
ncbi:type II toxin-antitoxin system Phd/YefM family antitoxin, partial [Sinorhizobium medicae]|nr:type II toxin-antitoxin system Phd/YefM family antitoxin [Sinorhizobium medicae]